MDKPSANAVPRGPTPPSTRRKALRRLAILSVALGGLALLHPFVLRGLGALLTVDEDAAEATHILLAGGDGRFDAAAALVRENGRRRVLIIRFRPSHLVRLGILPSHEVLCRRELAGRGVPDEVIESVPGEARNEWQAATLLDGWLAQRPEARVAVLCDRFKGRQERWVLDAALTDGRAAQVRVWGLPDRRFDETNWWKTRRGVKEVFVSLLGLTYTWTGGGREPQAPDWDPDDYERGLREALAGRAP